MTYPKLRGKIAERYTSHTSFARALKISPEALSKKLNHRAPWKDSDMARSMKLLNISAAEVGAIFFEGVS